ncbi:MAG: mechanosensitive ion channel family protein [Myxococcota bacterium]
MSFIQQILEFASQNAAEWFWRLVAALATLLLAWAVRRVARSALRRTLDRSESTRVRTLRPLVQGLVTVTVLGTGVVLSLEQLGFDLTAVIAGAGVLGLAIGFGSQELVKDVIAGFFLIFDEVLEAGDWVDVDTISGHVEQVGLRVTRIRSFDGKLWYVPNGQIKLVGNTNRQWMRAVVFVELAYEQDVGRGLDQLVRVGEAWASEQPETVLEPPEVHGLLDLGASGLRARLVVKVKPGTHWAAERELRIRVKAAFDREGIEIPFGRQVVYLRQGEGSAS